MSSLKQSLPDVLALRLEEAITILERAGLAYVVEWSQQPRPREEDLVGTPTTYVVRQLCTVDNKIKLTVTNRYRKEVQNKMAYKIEKEECISCGTCAATCPVGAITEDTDGKYLIGDSCVECGACAGVCPVGAIKQP
ncbi:MAG: 4Fe-4S binding protein [Acidaminococcaceae bacterium]